ncbi:hypothetical protein ABEF95_012824 [Exophiala dermatitidis]
MPKHEGPAISKRDPPDLEVPQPGQDSAERKRILNVLAQRRYRERRRKHLERLEAKANTGDDSGSGHARSNSQQKDAELPSEKSGSEAQFPTQLSTGPGETVQERMAIHERQNLTLTPQQNPFSVFNGPGDMFGFPPTGSQSQSHCWDASASLRFPHDGSSTPSATNELRSSSGTGTKSTTPTLFLACSNPVGPVHDGQGEGKAAVPVTPMPMTQIPTTTSQAIMVQDDDIGIDIDMNVNIPPHSFPDEAYLGMSELKLLKGCMSIARRLNIHDLIWSLTSESPFFSTPDFDMGMASGMAICDPDLDLGFGHLPPNLQPTFNQITSPHHPIIDLLPWPSVRDKMIMVLSQPPEARPSAAASPMALLEFVYDIEDTAEGIRIFGGDPFSSRNWEVGEKVFRSWWWLFDRDIIRRSNELRALRGASILGSLGSSSGSGSVLGEVG